MNPQRRQLFTAIGALFGAGLLHSLLPPGDLWMRAALTAVAAVFIFGLLAWLLPHPPKT
jgi:hypothetical protein